MLSGSLRGLVAAIVLGISQLIAASARADVPAGYLGKPFDPAVAGGVGKIPPTVKAGPYPIPGRIDVVNYDLGGVNVAYNSGLHETNHAGNGYRTDTPAPTLCLTSQGDKDDWYDTSTSLDGTSYPTTTSQDFYVGAVQNGDWFNFTVDVQTTGTYSISSTWATGNGPPGGEGGDGTMGLEVFVNGTMETTWTATFPNYMTEASYHNWKSYPSFATIALSAGIQVIKLESTTKHLNLDYVEFALLASDGGVESGDGSSGSAAGGSGSVVASAGSSSSAGAAASGNAPTNGSGSTAASGFFATSGGAAASGSSLSSGGDTAAATGGIESSGSTSTSSSGGSQVSSGTASATIGGNATAGQTGSGCGIAQWTQAGTQARMQGRGLCGFGPVLCGVLLAFVRRRTKRS